MRRQFSYRESHLQIWFAAATLAAAATACGGGNSRPAPTAPTTASAAAPAPAINGATVTGTVATGITTSAFRTAAAGLTVSVDGTALAVSVDGTGAFTLTGVPTGNIMLHFSGAGADARLEVDNVTEHETIELDVHVSGGQVDVDDNRRETADHRLEIEGRIAEVNVSARTLRVRTTTVSVPDGTPIHHGSTTIDFKSLQVNDRVHIHATSTGATTATAQDVEVQTDHPGQNPGDGNGGGSGDNQGGDNHNDNNEVELSGTVAAKAGTCPAITFTLATTTVKTSASTQFSDTTCAALANGDRVEVSGTRQSSTTVLALQVEKKK